MSQRFLFCFSLPDFLSFFLFLLSIISFCKCSVPYCDVCHGYILIDTNMASFLILINHYMIQINVQLCESFWCFTMDTFSMINIDNSISCLQYSITYKLVFHSVNHFSDFLCLSFIDTYMTPFLSLITIIYFLLVFHIVNLFLWFTMDTFFSDTDSRFHFSLEHFFAFLQCSIV